MESVLLMLAGIIAGYALTMRSRRNRIEELERQISGHSCEKKEPSVPPRTAQEVYDATYPPRERARDAEHLELLDEFVRLQRLRHGVIKRAQQAGDLSMLGSEEMMLLTVDTLEVLGKLKEIEPEGFFKDLYEELLTEVREQGGTVQ
jgi:hypothetical protein